ncbi:hypothetical protein [Rhodobacter sp. NSM]|uniref:hypothetical protein n=1 Tax=Rhodobacter sp. NSM TaxID=3457501 RepID=UPI003FD14A72
MSEAISARWRTAAMVSGAVLVRGAVLNGFTALGTPITESQGISPSGERGTLALRRFVQQSRKEVEAIGPEAHVQIMWRCGERRLDRPRRTVGIAACAGRIRQKVERLLCPLVQCHPALLLRQIAA